MSNPEDGARSESRPSFPRTHAMHRESIAERVIERELALIAAEVFAAEESQSTPVRSRNDAMLVLDVVERCRGVVLQGMSAGDYGEAVYGILPTVRQSVSSVVQLLIAAHLGDSSAALERNPTMDHWRYCAGEIRRRLRTSDGRRRMKSLTEAFIDAVEMRESRFPDIALTERK